jgi:hypothetical protein
MKKKLKSLRNAKLCTSLQSFPKMGTVTNLSQISGRQNSAPDSTYCWRYDIEVGTGVWGWIVVDDDCIESPPALGMM